MLVLTEIEIDSLKILLEGVLTNYFFIQVIIFFKNTFIIYLKNRIKLKKNTFKKYKLHQNFNKI